MQNMGQEGEDCPFTFNFDPATFKVGDTISYRVSTMADFPFIGQLLEVHDDHVIIAGDPLDPKVRYRGTREDRPMVDGTQI
jgi:hypothetical protein